MSYFCRLDPVDDAVNIIAVCVQGREAYVVQSSVMLLQTKKAEKLTLNVRQTVSTMKR